MTDLVATGGQRITFTVGDAAAAAQIEKHLYASADITVVTPTVCQSIEDWHLRQLLRWHAREATLEDLLAADTVVNTVRSAETRDRTTSTTAGHVTLVGGGPSDPGLLTLAGHAALAEADVIVTDRLAPLAALADLRPGTELIDVGKIPHGRSTPQADINALLIEHARAGRRVVRLKGGDSFVFGRGGEEVNACRSAGIEYTVIPGVSSSIAAPALAGIPVTQRGLVQGFTVISGHLRPGHPESTIDYAALASVGTTIVVLMGVRTLAAITNALADAGLDPHTPAAVVADAGRPTQQTVHGTLATIADLADEAGIGAPAVSVIGDVVALAQPS